MIVFKLFFCLIIDICFKIDVKLSFSVLLDGV